VISYFLYIVNDIISGTHTAAVGQRFWAHLRP